MAFLTLQTRAERLVIDHLCGPVIRNVTCGALGALARETVNGGTLVARLTLHSCVSANQGKAVLVLLDGFSGDLPTELGMATLAVCAKASSVDVGVAVGALVVRLGKNQAGVTVSTRHRGMESLELKPGRLVIEIGLLPDGRPACRRMAVFAD
jgi:hypothetical protein